MRIAALLTMLIGMTAQAAVIDFEEFDAGDVVKELYLSGVNITVNSTLVQGLPSAMVFDTLNPTGNDWDLAGPFSDVRGGADLIVGNVLIISEDQDASDPDDRARGGFFEFNFDVPVTLEDVAVFDINRKKGIKITLFGEQGEIATIYNDYIGPDNSFERVNLTRTGVVRAVFELKGSGAIGELAFSYNPPIPIPGSAIIFGTGLFAALFGSRLKPRP